ncbi:universal stress protein [Streptomyces zingiberis]|uniref:Universal stress protein n=1 Tax=Streptomyces zingiberis TaxID=2053010 RepID=A0ABX1BTG4_9ACTN|nr:universal stress protein [Streptomyces zingiberis]NJQ00383.1 universal stress protein [Streptomyces zingiberis]
MAEPEPQPGHSGPRGPVLVGVDDAYDQQIVVRHGAAEAARREVALHILHAVEWPLPTGAAEAYGHVSEPQAQAASVLEAFTRRAHAEFPGLPVVAEPFTGRPAAALVERSAAASLVVVGHRGTGGFPRLPLGSVSWQVATHARCPVLVVRPGSTPARPAHRVVAGVDPADLAAEPLRFAVTEAALREAELTLLAAGDGHRQGAADLADVAAAWRHEYPDLTVTTRIVPGGAAAALADASSDAELVVVGSRGRTGVRRALLGSVSAAVLHTADCPVTVVPVGPDGG